MKRVLFSFFIFFSNFSQACWTTPGEFVANDEAFVARTKQIYWVEAVSKKDNFEYEFKVLDDLRASKQNLSGFAKFLIALGFKKYEPSAGNVEKINFQGSDRPYKPSEYGDHKSEDFMKGWNGRVNMESDCELYPTFEVGKKYLLFIDKPYHFKSFEEVNSIDDVWYSKVRDLISN